MVTMPFSVRQGINAFLAGFIQTENLRFRDDALSFKVRIKSKLGSLSVIDLAVVSFIFHFYRYQSVQKQVISKMMS